MNRAFEQRVKNARQLIGPRAYFAGCEALRRGHMGWRKDSRARGEHYNASEIDGRGHTSIADDEVVYVAVGVGVAGLQSEHVRVGRGVQLDHGLHRQRPVDEVRRLVVHVLYVDDDALVVRICGSSRVHH